MSSEPLRISSWPSLDNSHGEFDTIHYEEIRMQGGKHLSLFSSDSICMV